MIALASTCISSALFRWTLIDFHHSPWCMHLARAMAITTMKRTAAHTIFRNSSRNQSPLQLIARGSWHVGPGVPGSADPPSGRSIPDPLDCMVDFRMAAELRLQTPVQGKSEREWTSKSNCSHLPCTMGRLVMATEAICRIVQARRQAMMDDVEGANTAITDEPNIHAGANH